MARAGGGMFRPGMGGGPGRGGGQVAPLSEDIHSIWGRPPGNSTVFITNYGQTGTGAGRGGPASVPPSTGIPPGRGGPEHPGVPVAPDGPDQREIPGHSLGLGSGAGSRPGPPPGGFPVHWERDAGRPRGSLQPPIQGLLQYGAPGREGRPSPPRTTRDSRSFSGAPRGASPRLHTRVTLWPCAPAAPARPAPLLPRSRAPGATGLSLLWAGSQLAPGAARGGPLGGMVRWPPPVVPLGQPPAPTAPPVPDPGRQCPGPLGCGPAGGLAGISVPGPPGVRPGQLPGPVVQGNPGRQGPGCLPPGVGREGPGRRSAPPPGWVPPLPGSQPPGTRAPRDRLLPGWWAPGWARAGGPPVCPCQLASPPGRPPGPRGHCSPGPGAAWASSPGEGPGGGDSWPAGPGGEPVDPPPGPPPRPEP